MNATPAIAPETIQTLVAQAAASGLSVDEYLRQLLGIMNGTQPAPDMSDESFDGFMADLEALAEGTEHLPSAALTYSREDIYFDHD